MRKHLQHLPPYIHPFYVSSSLILSDFHSVSVSEPSQRVEMTDMEVEMLADMEVDKVANMEVDLVADIVADINININIGIDIDINMEIQFGERVGHNSQGLVDWAQTFTTQSLLGRPASASSKLCEFILKSFFRSLE